MSDSSIAKIYENLPDNSHKGRQEKQEKRQMASSEASEGKRAEKVVKGNVKVKKNAGRKFADIFISEDISNVKNYVLFDIIVPSIKTALYESIRSGLDMFLFGGRGSGSSRRPNADRYSYTDYSGSSTRRREERSYERNRTTSGYSYDDLVFDTRGEAEAVLSRMDEIMDEYEIVRVADLYDLAGVTGAHTDNNYGWSNIRNAEIVRVRDGYMIKMPRALPIK